MAAKGFDAKKIKKALQKNKKVTITVSVIVVAALVFASAWVVSPEGVNDFFASLGALPQMVGTSGSPNDPAGIAEDVGSKAGGTVSGEELTKCGTEMCEYLTMDSVSLPEGHEFKNFAKVDYKNKDDCNEFINMIKNTKCDKIRFSDNPDGTGSGEYAYIEDPTGKEINLTLMLYPCSDPKKDNSVSLPYVCQYGQIKSNGEFYLKDDLNNKIYEKSLDYIEEISDYSTWKQVGAKYLHCYDSSDKIISTYEITDYCIQGNFIYRWSEVFKVVDFDYDYGANVTIDPSSKLAVYPSDNPRHDEPVCYLENGNKAKVDGIYWMGRGYYLLLDFNSKSEFAGSTPQCSGKGLAQYTSSPNSPCNGNEQYYELEAGYGYKYCFADNDWFFCTNHPEDPNVPLYESTSLSTANSYKEAVDVCCGTGATSGFFKAPEGTTAVTTGYKCSDTQTATKVYPESSASV